MPEFQLTIIDNKIKVVSSYPGWTGPLLAASKNPDTVDEFRRIHDAIAGARVYRDPWLSDKEISSVDFDGLISLLATGDCPRSVLEKMSLDEILRRARGPNFQVYADGASVSGADGRVSLGPNPPLGSYDGALVIDLKHRHVGFVGRPRIAIFDPTDERDALKILQQEEKERAKGEPEYEWFHFISDTRSGKATFEHNGPDGYVYSYKFKPDWKFLDLVSGRQY